MENLLFFLVLILLVTLLEWWIYSRVGKHIHQLADILEGNKSEDEA